MLCTCGASMGDRYGPIVVAKKKIPLAALQSAVIAVPGELTTAFLALQLVIGKKFSYVVVPFDKILDAVVAGEYAGKKIDAGLVIHEGQLTYSDQKLALIVDTGVWWYEQTGLPLPLGANGIRKDLGPVVIHDVQRLLKESIAYGLSHREEALGYALSFGRGLDPRKADRFVAMYVNEWTLDFGSRGRQAVADLLARGYRAGAIPNLVIPEFAS
jgi:1,4-dihydroxy-6-naphthoate synthase